ncbi:hypothetical protein UNDYM_5975 (plasmid) [Undibacterium sp. YM2]|nr:hypothetical protein UNDYM_5975 [Undibacterium sp. YM2]
MLIGSHNLTLSGFGYNREISNWIEIGSTKDGDGAAILAAAWRMARQWIEMQRGKSAEPLLDAALALGEFVNPFIVNAVPAGNVFALAHSPSGTSLIDQLAERVTSNVQRIGVIGAFFDTELALIAELKKRWPMAEIVVGIDPESVQMPGSPSPGVARYVDARHLWTDNKNYLHAKAIYFEAGQDSAFVSGSANPSRPAWISQASNGNVEAVLLRIGQSAIDTATEVGICGLFDLDSVGEEVLKNVKTRTAIERASNEVDPVPLLIGIANHESGNLDITLRADLMSFDHVVLLGADMEEISEVYSPVSSDGVLRLSVKDELTLVRACSLYSGTSLVARVMVHHPSVISARAQSTRQYQIRSALNGLGSTEGDISKVIASVQRVIFSDDTHREVTAAMRSHREKESKQADEIVPDTLAISVSDLPKEKKKIRLLKSGDLAYLLDVLLRRIREGLELSTSETDSSGRTEEERVGQEDEDVENPPVSMLPATSLDDSKIAQAVASRAKSLTNAMLAQLKHAKKDTERRSSVVFQLIAVLALVRELRYLDKSPRWKKTGCLLVAEGDRRRLFDESLIHLLGGDMRLFDSIELASDGGTEEGVQLRVLLLWLAWDLGDELTDHIDRLGERKELEPKLRTNAAFLKLMPPISCDMNARADLKQSIDHTVKPTPEAAERANIWLKRHLRFGVEWQDGYVESGNLCVGGYCIVPGKMPEPRVIYEISGGTICFWDFDRVRRFERCRVSAVEPNVVN